MKHWGTLLLILATAGCGRSEPNNAIVMRAISAQVPLPDCNVNLTKFDQADLSRISQINRGNTLVLEADFELSRHCNDAWTDQLLRAGFSGYPPHGCCYKGAIFGKGEASVSAGRVNDTGRHIMVPISKPLVSVPWYNDKS